MGSLRSFTPWIRNSQKAPVLFFVRFQQNGERTAGKTTVGGDAEKICKRNDTVNCLRLKRRAFAKNPTLLAAAALLSFFSAALLLQFFLDFVFLILF